jgi:septal ring factor EnvC (AmiA/AmiB activator)
MAPADDADAKLERELAGLKGEYDRLRDAKVRTEQDLTHLQNQLAELEARAVAEYGTADPAELLRLLEEKRAENARLVAEYREHVAAVRRELEAVERDFAGN